MEGFFFGVCWFFKTLSQTPASLKLIQANGQAGFTAQEEVEEREGGGGEEMRLFFFFGIWRKSSGLEKQKQNGLSARAKEPKKVNGGSGCAALSRLRESSPDIRIKFVRD